MRCMLMCAFVRGLMETATQNTTHCIVLVATLFAHAYTQQKKSKPVYKHKSTRNITVGVDLVIKH
jgi:hypothetical protein